MVAAAPLAYFNEFVFVAVATRDGVLELYPNSGGTFPQCACLCLAFRVWVHPKMCLSERTFVCLCFLVSVA